MHQPSLPFQDNARGIVEIVAESGKLPQGWEILAALDAI
jgi:hypothetical protein